MPLRKATARRTDHMPIRNAFERRALVSQPTAYLPPSIVYYLGIHVGRLTDPWRSFSAFLFRTRMRCDTAPASVRRPMTSGYVPPYVTVIGRGTTSSEACTNSAGRVPAHQSRSEANALEQLADLDSPVPFMTA